MDNSSLTSTISILVVFASSILAVFLFTLKTENKLSNILLGGFIALNALDISGLFLTGYTQDYPGLQMFRLRCSFLINPLYFLYVISVCYSDFRLRPKHLLHALPFLVANIAMAPRFYLVDTNGKFNFFQNYGQMPEVVFTQRLGLLQSVFYLMGVFWVLKQYRMVYLENFTDTKTSAYKWLCNLTILLTIIHSIVILKGLLKFTPYAGVVNAFQVLVSVNALLFVCWLVFKALHHPELFRGIDSNLPLASTLTKTLTSSMDHPEPWQSVEAIPQVKLLREYMQQKKPYLNPSLTIQQLAHGIGMDTKDLSVLINHRLDQHFFDFVNEYRVKHAMEILRDPSKGKLTVLEILYEVGFNSKSSFHAAFKKHSDLPPTQFRKSTSLSTI